MGGGGGGGGRRRHEGAVIGAREHMGGVARGPAPPTAHAGLASHASCTLPLPTHHVSYRNCSNGSGQAGWRCVREEARPWAGGPGGGARSGRQTPKVQHPSPQGAHLLNDAACEPCLWKQRGDRKGGGMKQALRPSVALCPPPPPPPTTTTHTHTHPGLLHHRCAHKLAPGIGFGGRGGRGGGGGGGIRRCRRPLARCRQQPHVAFGAQHCRTLVPVCRCRHPAHNQYHNQGRHQIDKRRRACFWSGEGRVQFAQQASGERRRRRQRAAQVRQRSQLHTRTHC